MRDGVIYFSSLIHVTIVFLILDNSENTVVLYRNCDRDQIYITTMTKQTEEPEIQKEKNSASDSMEIPELHNDGSIELSASQPRKDINAPNNSNEDTTTSNNNNSNSRESSQLYPKAFYCPLTEQLLENPVVTPEGISYERTALEARGDDMTKVYENRALKSIIAEAVEYKTSSSLKRFQYSVRQFSQQLINEYHRPLPDSYYCPITLGLIHFPVIDPEGYSYEKVAIENWIRCNGASPVTRQTISLEDLYPNRTLAALMEEEKMKSDDLMHPTFKEWKNEAAPTMGLVDLESGSTHGPPAITFPTTPEQLEEANRRRRIRRYQRCVLWIITIIVLGIMAWMVPVMSTVILVCTLLGVGIVAGYSSRSDAFRDA